ncbi:tetratricopeptide repeat protein [Campylobacter vicugnae]|uniref:tetratricopeptide repeat protein n=1 Tax=Campylobacter vicugnae TaxID=1660076 RepID=UPI00254D1B50|nr:GTP pyrophosphokinase [Campylobacter ovis]MDL0104551.1 GTP pyrophosphokinase [Campylobacter ovis]MDL0106271.1 GTP pyrophosphokinase [Campylobacter ovis]
MADELKELKQEQQEVVILEKDMDIDEDIIPIESPEDNQAPITPQQEETLEEPEEISHKPKFKFDKKLIMLIASGLFCIILLIILAIMAFTSKDEEPEPILPTQANPIIPPTITQKFQSSKIDSMLIKANKLYESGNKIEALKLYENIAVYNESLSKYNLGVSKMNQGLYKEAIETFKEAIANNENITVSAINIAVCALEIKDEELFKYYIDLANAFINRDSDVNLYEFYNALVNYYRGFYIEALHTLDLSDSKYYTSQKEYLKSKILSYLHEDKEAIKAIKAVEDYDINLPLGLLHARLGEYKEAKQYLNKALVDEKNAPSTYLAISLIDIKTGEFASAATTLKMLNDYNSTFIKDTYPIKAILNPELFNINLAQQNYDMNIFFDQNSLYQILFYFTPYKAFDPKQTIEYIRKGGLSLFVDENSVANEYLQTSGIVSKANVMLSNAILKALNNQLREANSDFLEIIKLYPNHSILQFNLALTFAQLGDFAQAYKHFVTSYHLDTSNYIAGAYAIMTAKMIGKDAKRLTNEILDSMGLDSNLDQDNIYKAMIQLTQGNESALNSWLDKNKNDTVLDTVFNIITAYITNRSEVIIPATDILNQKLPNDVLVNIIYSATRFDSQNIKNYAKDIQTKFLTTKLDKGALYGGATIIRTQYIKLLQIAGLLHKERENIVSDLKVSTQNTKDILYTLAYLDLFTGHYEEAYTIYNELINNENIDDANTLFLASVASIGANHPDSAIGYLELSKLTNPTYAESRLALGLLYQEVGNIDAAITQYNGLGNSGYKSKFFTFKLE